MNVVRHANAEPQSSGLGCATVSDRSRLGKLKGDGYFLIHPRGTAEFWLGLRDVTLCRFPLIRQHDEASGRASVSGIGFGEQDGSGNR
jgi:hypothetical protein